jgi:hypothetical protein
MSQANRAVGQYVLADHSGSSTPGVDMIPRNVFAVAAAAVIGAATPSSIQFATVTVVAVCCLGSPIATQPADAAPIDRTNSPEAREIERVVKKRYVQGNAGEAHVERLTFDPATGRVEFKLYIRHRHRVRGINVYECRQHAEAWYNVRTSEGDVTLHLGRGVRVRASDIVRIIANW